MLNNRVSRNRIAKAVVRAMIEPLELRRLLSATLPDPIAEPLVEASPAAGGLSSGATTPPSSAYTPAQIKSAYGISSIKLNGVVGDGTGQTIAIVTADDDPKLVSSSSSSFATSDLHIFDKEFGLPDPPSFTKIEQFADGSNPTADTGWSEEASLDVEWTHAIAPGAKIILVEAHGAGAVQLLDYGVQTAAQQPGVSVVNTSFGFGEFSGENEYDQDFTTPGGHTSVTFVASTGDTGAPGLYPAFSPNVLAVGGTHLSISGSSYSSEVAYSSSGGGISDFENEPGYQASVAHSPTGRATPDVSIDGDPNTGVDVYDSYNGGYPGWYKIAGTSFSAPAWAGLIAITDQGRAIAKSSPLDGLSQTLPKLYALPSSDFHDITSGNNGFAASTGYDLVTGRGSPIANLLVPALAGLSSTTTPPPPTASIAGMVYVDSNSNGKLDSGEKGLAGVKVFMDINKDGVLDNAEPSYPVSSNGEYIFTRLPAGTYEMREILPSGYVLTSPSGGYLNVTVTTGAVTNENFGNAKIIASISGYAYTDTNSDGKFDNGEKGLSGVTLFLDANSNGKLDSGEVAVTTNSSGYYYLPLTTAATFRLVEVLPSGDHLTNPKAGFYSVVIKAGTNLQNEDWGNVK